PQFEITMFGDETHVNYNRILLSSVLAGEKAAAEIQLNGIDWYEKHGIALRLGVRITDVDGERKTVTGDDGSITPFDKLLIATGIRPNVGPGRKAVLRVDRGIVVNHYIETSNPDTFAVGECVEHNGTCYGLVAPLSDQGKVLAATITGSRGAVYGGTIQAAKL